MTDYYTASGNPSTSASLSSATQRAEHALIEAGFGKLAAYTGNADKVVVINSAGTAQSAVSAATFLSTNLGITSSAAELNILDGVTATATELNYSSGVTSAIQTQLDAKVDETHTGNVSITGAVDITGDIDVDNININGNTISSTDANGDVNVTPNGTGNLSTPRIRVTSSTDATLSSTGHGFQVGSDSGLNLIIDNNEIMARNNGAASNLFLNTDGGGVYINTKLAASIETGSWTPTWGGFSSAPSGDLNWARSGDVVTIYRGGTGLTGTSNLASMSISNLPAAITPTAEKRVMCSALVDNSVQILVGDVLVRNTSTLVFNLGLVNGSYLDVGPNNFTGSGTKGLVSGFSITYSLD